MNFDRRKPFNDLPLLPPAVDLESAGILKLAISANKALAELKGILNTLPNPEILINPIVLQEAKSSSLVENIVTTNDKLYQSAAGGDQTIDLSTKEVLNYREAIWYGFEILKEHSQITTSTLIRILNIMFLIYADLLSLPVLFLSKFIIENKVKYYSLIRDVTEKQDWLPWIQFMLQGTEDTAKFTLGMVGEIRTLLDETVDVVKSELPKIYSRELVEMLFEQPYCRVRNLVDAGIATRNTASKYLRELTRIGVLDQQQVWKEKLYLNIRLWGLLQSN